MCTVTFLPIGLDGFTLTSNRDEAPDRETLMPMEYTIDGVKLLFPKDTEAGGSWIGLSEKKRLVCLLNGGFVAHERASKYSMSRGVVVTHLLTAANAQEAITAFSFNGIEPFTIILVDWVEELTLHELVWDGAKISLSEKPLAPHIWSSSLLYTAVVKKEREDWFSSFLYKNARPSTTEILDFHTSAGVGNPETDLIMDRNFVKTKSITQVYLEDTPIRMQYQDLEQEKTSNISF
jgi:hypothetical protein